MRRLIVLLVLACAGPAWAQDEPPTWARDVAPVLHRHCVACHQEGGGAPFALTDYDDARSRARLLAEVTASGYMPPWLPEPGPPFANERRLAAPDVALIARWVAAGAPSGDLDAAPVPAPPSRGWVLGEPDLVVEMPEPFVLPADGDEIFRGFVLQIGDPVPQIGDSAPQIGDSVAPIGDTVPPVRTTVEARRWVRAVEILPGAAGVVHHATLLADRTDSSRRLDAADDTPGFEGMRSFSRARAPDGHLLGWTPGKVPSPGNPDLAWELHAGSDLVLELHLVPSGRPASVRARVGLHFADGPPARRPLAVRLGRKTLDMAAGEAAHLVEDSFRLPAAADVFAVYPHAHYLCRSMVATAILPDGRVETLLEIRRWDLDWQDQYPYSEPIRLPEGTELRMEYVYDNSADNPKNPHRPPRRVVYGPTSGDEMGDLWLQVAPVDPADFARLSRALDRRESEANVAGWRAALARHPDDATLRFNLGSELVLTGVLDEGVVELERAAALDPSLGEAHTNLGNALVARAQRRGGADGRGDRDDGRAELERAAFHFERVVALGGDVESPDALFNLANTLAALGRFDDAHRRYDRALELRPLFVEARLNKGTAYVRQGRIGEAIVEIERCLDVDPTYVGALWNLVLLRGQSEGGLAAALASIERAVSVEPGSPQLRMLHADVLLRLERYEEAAGAYRVVVEVAPRSADAWANLARALARLGQREEAGRAVATALAIDAGHAGALAVSRELGPPL